MDDDVGAAFDAELHRMADAAHDAFAIEGTPTEPEGLTLRARADDGFDVGVKRSAHRVEIRIGPWTRCETWDETDEAGEILDEALDLVAAAMWGRLIVTETEAGGRPWRFRVRFVHADVEREVASGGGELLRWRPGAVSRDRCNRATPPRGTDERETGALPARPWIGLRGDITSSGEAALPLDGELDLHTFSPKEVAPLVREYIEACRERGVLTLRIVHGKGRGQLRRTVHALLSRHDAVAAYRLGGMGEGSWGATIVTLKR